MVCSTEVNEIAVVQRRSDLIEDIEWKSIQPLSDHGYN